MNNEVRITKRGQENISKGTNPYMAIIHTDDMAYMPASLQDVEKIREDVGKFHEDFLLFKEIIKDSLETNLPDNIPALFLPSDRPRNFDCHTPETKKDKIPEIIRQKFYRLASEWKNENKYSSSILEMSMHPAYQQIIGMGYEAVPFILESLAREPDHWFWALIAITGEDPVPAEEKGKLQAMTKGWLDWGARHGYEY